MPNSFVNFLTVCFCIHTNKTLFTLKEISYFHVNRINEGKCLKKCFIGLPAPPGKPILIPVSTEDTQPDVVGIRWERSPSNGGSAIIGYQVEHRRMGSPYWVRSSPTLCTFPELTLSGLEPGWRYQFRVRARNGLGLSEPSELSDPLTVTLQRSAASAPRFDLELKDTTALENEQVYLCSCKIFKKVFCNNSY